ncbi:MAG TPA: hypothetical protein PKC54_13060 [Ferruginibacter sp.]|nr:hypothetical protein [Ferruginibacter sp.]
MDNSQQQPRIKFKSTQHWQEYLNRLKQEAGGAPININFAANRIACYKEIEILRGRPLLVYATKFVNLNLPPLPIAIPNSIEISDIDGFTDLVNTIPTDKKSVDILIHSPGGKPDATERLVILLRQRFDEVHFLVPHSAYSAATMLALSGNTITLHSSATLGPIDPQINGRPARSIKKGFEKVRDQLKNTGAASLPAYVPLLEKLSLELLEICDDSEALSKELVGEWLRSYMLSTEEYPGQIEQVVDFFSDYDSHKIHSRPLVLSKLKEFKLKIDLAAPDLAELMWDAYIQLDNFFAMTNFVKLYENTYGVSWGRNLNIQLAPQSMGPQKGVNQIMD